MQGMPVDICPNNSGLANRFPAILRACVRGTAMDKFSVDEIGHYLAVGYWDAAGAFPPNLGAAITVNMSSLTDDNKYLARLALDAWSELGLNFEFTTGTAQLLLTDDNNGGATDWTRFEWEFGSTPVWGYQPTSNVGPDFTEYYGSKFGSYTYQSWLHEIGHALGLGHTGNYNGKGDYDRDALFSNDSWQMSVMSYFSQTENTSINASRAYVLTPMPGDIAAIQRIYGDIGSPGEGNTTYFWNTNAAGIHGTIGRQIAAGTLKGPFALTIMDSSGVDTLDFRGSNKALALDLAPGAISSAFGLRGNILIERETIIENVVATKADDVITGQDARNKMFGRQGDDRLYGRDGNDTLRGDDGNDVLYGEAGDDKLTGGDGRDLLHGGPGSDTVYYSGQLRLDLMRLASATGDAAGDTLHSIENVYGGGSDDVLTGDHKHNTLVGGDGNDRLSGRAGHDVLDGGAGNDSLSGSNGNDVLDGGAGVDTLSGGTDNDRLSAGAGNDILDGGTGLDTLLGGDGDDRLNGSYGDDLLDGGTGTDIMRGGEGNDRLVAGVGHDRLYVDAGKDSVTGGLGIDSFVFQGGRMVVLDFTDNRDEVVIDRDALGLLDLTIDALVDAARVLHGDLLFDFAPGSYIRIAGVTDAELLANDLILA